MGNVFFCFFLKAALVLVCKGAHQAHFVAGAARCFCDRKHACMSEWVCWYSETGRGRIARPWSAARKSLTVLTPSPWWWPHTAGMESLGMHRMQMICVAPQNLSDIRAVVRGGGGGLHGGSTLSLVTVTSYWCNGACFVKHVPSLSALYAVSKHGCWHRNGAVSRCRTGGALLSGGGTQNIRCSEVFLQTPGWAVTWNISDS